MHFNQLSINRAAGVTRALAHPVRMKILKFLNENPDCPTNAIYNKLKLEQSVCSQHLRILRNADIVVPNKNGKITHHELDFSRVKAVVSAVNKFLKK